MFKSQLNVVKASAAVIGMASLFSFISAHAYDTSKIPSRPSSPISLSSGETYDFKGRTIDGSRIGSSDALFRCIGKSSVNLKNVKIVGSPRYAAFIRGCRITLENITMENSSGSVGGIRFDKGTENKSVRLYNIKANGQGGHAVELWDVNGFTIGTVNAKNTSKSGLLINRSRSGTVSKVDGYRNDRSGGYASLRYANNAGPSLRAKTVKSRESGRGFFTVSGSRDIDMDYVDISGANREGIYIQDSTDVKVKSGKSRGRTNCLIRGGSSNSIKANCG